MRILVTIPHFFAADSAAQRHGSQRSNAAARISALQRTILALHQHFGARQQFLNIKRRELVAANDAIPSDVHIVICTAGGQHVLAQLKIDRSLYQHQPMDVQPMMLGFSCHTMLRDRWGNYDYFCYLEDDLVIHDPWHFLKLKWFTSHVGDDKLLLPNRFEVSTRSDCPKLWIDGDIASRVTAKFQNVSDQPQLGTNILGVDMRYHRPLNPHSGCFFLNADQMQHWAAQPFFNDQDASFISPLESAATLGIMRAFKIYKPAPENASFLEIEHHGSGFIQRMNQTEAD